MCIFLPVLLFSIHNSQAQVCTPVFSAVEPITYVNFGSIQNSTSWSSSDAYEDFTDQNTQVSPGVNYVISAKGYTGGNYTNYFTVFVDWNQNGTLNDEGEVYSIGTITNSTGIDFKMTAGNIGVPPEAAMGFTRMRVLKTYLAYPTDPCADYYYGQVEDYTVEIVPVDVCAGVVSAGIPDEDNILICANDAFIISVSGATGPADGLERIWQSSPAGLNNWITIDGATETDHLVAAGIITDTDYRYALTCSNNAANDVSDVIKVHTNSDISACFCSPEGTDAEKYIDSFVTSGGVQNITNQTSGYAPDGYGDYTAITAEQVPNGTVDFTSEIFGGLAGFRMWADWNQDGQFDSESEVIYQSTELLNSHSGSFMVPENAVVGATRIRIASNTMSETGSVDPCVNSFSQGEFEDYGFVVTAPGVICESAIPITQLPFQTTDNTANYGDDYDNTDLPPVAPDAPGSYIPVYLKGDDVVYTYTPESEELIDISVSNHGYATGFFILTGCPFETVLGGQTDWFLGPLHLDQFSVHQGTTYYIVISTFPSPQSTDYTLIISKTTFDCPILEANFGESCDDGNPLTGSDRIRENCECKGDPGYTLESALPLECDADPVTFSPANSDALKPPVSGCDEYLRNNGLYFSITGTGGDITIYTTSNLKHTAAAKKASETGPGACSAGYSSSIIMLNDTDPGDLYYLYVSNYIYGDLSDINFTIYIDCAPIPENNNCENAIALSCGDVVEGTTVAATNSGLEVPDCISNGENEFDGPQLDVFYTLEVMEGVEYTIFVDGESYPNVLSLYSGICGNLSEIGCAANILNPELENTLLFIAATSETLIVRASSYSTTTDGFTISVACEDPVDCPSLDGNIGDSCDDGNPNTAYDSIDENCVCKGVPVTCEEMRYFIIDHDVNQGISDIYEITLGNETATMTYLASSDIEVHIAYNNANKHIYAISKYENSYRDLNPLTGIWGPTIMLGADYGEITATTFAPNGKLVFASQNQDAIYSLDISSNVVSEYDSYAPVSEGDLAFSLEGILYMASRSGNGLYKINPAPMSDLFLGNVPQNVTGLALTQDDQLLVSARGMTSLKCYTLDGASSSTFYTLELNGALYTLHDGDMASGCNTPTIEDCENPATFYVNHETNGEGSDLYKIDFASGNAELTFITHIDFIAHIGYNAENDLMYFINKDGSFIRPFNVGADTFEEDLPILGEVGQIAAVEYNLVDGRIYVGDTDSDMIESIDPSTGIASYYADAPVSGGDLALLDGTLYLSRNSVNELYEIVPSGNAILIGAIPAGVNGMTPSFTPGNLVVSSAAENAFMEISAIDGATVGSYPAMLNGESFSFSDGDMAWGCMNEAEISVPYFESFDETQTILSTFPNPTFGISQVVFVVNQTARTLVQVHDMNGRTLATLFNQEAEKNVEYHLDFDGSYLLNGVYFYRLTTQNETIIEKFVIAR